MNTFEPPSDEPSARAGTPEEIAHFVVEAAVNAPSVHNTQPWWFYGIDHEIGMHADVDRRLPIADPQGREMMISCGDYERELFAEIPRRRTHRGGFDAGPLPDGILAALGDEASKENAALRILGDQAQRDALAAVVEAGDYALRQDGARAREEAAWAPSPGSKRRDGVPATAYPARPERTEPDFPARDFAHGHGWGLPPADQGQLPRSAGVVGLLTTADDRPADWIGAGQALQRVLLFATSCGLAAALHSQPLEITELRAFTSAQFCGGAHPQMVLRFGATGQTAVSVRRPVDDVLI